MDSMEVFRNAEFGEMRILREGDGFLFCGRDVALALGYKDAVSALKRHCKGG